MRATNSPRRHPAGFTLIELLVVISIIGVLMGLLLGAVQKVRDVGRRTTAVTEINQLSMSVTGFKKDFTINPPQYIRLPGMVPPPAWQGGTQIQQESYAGFQQLLQMFPRWQLKTKNPVALTNSATEQANVGAATEIEFRGVQAVNDAAGTGLVLQGSQSLVFFLGGPLTKGFKPSGPYDPDLPAPAPPATSRKGPYFNFVINRLVPAIDPESLVAQPQYRDGYLDPYGTPYAYFSSSSGRDYTPSSNWEPPAIYSPSTNNPSYVNNTVAFVPGTLALIPPCPTTDKYLVRPYQDPTGKWVNADGVQIISAGKNKRFGQGTVGVNSPSTGYLTVNTAKRWVPGDPGYAQDAAAPAGDGGDDLANFNGGLQLGVSSN